MSEVRRFRIRGGFSDRGIDYIEFPLIGNRQPVHVLLDGTRTLKHNTVKPLSYFIEQVSLGYWVELKQESEEPKMCKGGCKCGENEGFKSFVDGIFDSMAYSLCVPKHMLKQPEPIDFSTAQVGDTVRCLLNGDCKVESIGSLKADPYPINVEFDDGDDCYAVDGRLHVNHKNPCLIGFVDSDGKLCRTRPEPKIDWSKVAIDAPVEVTDDGIKEVSHFAGEIGQWTNAPRFWCEGKTSHTTTFKKSSRHATYKLINTEEK